VTVLAPMILLPIEEVACQVAVDADDPAGGTFLLETTAATENAESDAETVDRRCVRCTENQARPPRLIRLQLAIFIGVSKYDPWGRHPAVRGVG